MERYVVRKRFGGEEWDVRQFVQPNTPGVVAIAESLSSLPKDRFVEAAWEWVVNNIEYPPGDVETADRHYLEAFTGRARRRFLTYEYWSFPAETLSLGWGDCEDASLVLASILRNRLSENEVFVTVGEFKGFGHAWVTVNNLVLEATPPLERPAKYTAIAERGSPYNPAFRFNDRIAVPVRQVVVNKRRGKLPAIGSFYRSLTGRLA